MTKGLYTDATTAADRAVVEAVNAVARGRDIPPAQVALAWVLSRSVVTTPIVGATSVGHLEDAAAALDVRLSAEEIAILESPYRPHAVVGSA